eukprot:Nk52_evm3s169 gene=Nk52_evmTU3s169
MALFERLWVNREEHVQSYFGKFLEAEEVRDREFNAAVKIQASYRGFHVRDRVLYMNTEAKKIQRSFRGYRGRKRTAFIIKMKLFQERSKFYSSNAVRIQKVWRGYYTRKYIHDFYTLKLYLAELEKKNDHVLHALNMYTKEQEQLREHKRLEELKKQEQVRNGSPPRVVRPKLSWDVKDMFEPIKALPRPRYLPELDPYNPQLMAAKNASRIHGRSNNDHQGGKMANGKGKSKARSTATLLSVKGPFRDREKVFNLRHRPLKPTLRVITNYESEREQKLKEKAAEWCKRVSEERFINRALPDYTYRQMLLSSEPFADRKGYGTDQFRDVVKEQWKDKRGNDFKSYCRPVPLFEEFMDD